MTEGVELRSSEGGVVLGGPGFPVADGQVMVFDAATGKWFPQTPSTGSVPPLTKVAYADTAALAGGDGSIAKPFQQPQEAHDAGFTTCYLAPGAYAGVAIGAALFGMLGLGADKSEVSVATIGVAGGGSIVHVENMTFGDFDDTSAGCTLEVIDAVATGHVTGSTLTTTVRTGTKLQNNKAGFQPVSFQGTVQCLQLSAAWSRFIDTITVGAGGCTLQSSIFGSADITSGGAVDAVDCSFRRVTVTAPSTSTWRGCNATATITFDKCECYDSTFLGNVTGDTGGGLVFHNCDIRDAVDVPMTCDAATERRMLGQNDAPFGGGFIQSYDYDDAEQVNATVTLNYTGRTRAVVPDGVAGAAVVLTLDETGGANEQPFWVDNYEGTQTVTVKDSAAATLRVMTAGERAMFRKDTGTGKVVLAFPLYMHL